MAKPAHYVEWLERVFSGRSDGLPDQFHQQPAALVDSDPTRCAELFAHTMRNCERDLTPYSDDQVARGIAYLTDPSHSNFVFRIMQKPLPKQKRVCTLLSVQHLYQGCFGPRCTPALMHLNEAPASSLNTVCYMLWDVSPLLSGNPEAVRSVLSAALSNPNPACQESGLYGLGRLLLLGDSYLAVADIINTYLTKPSPREELKIFAARALRGF